MRSLPSLLCLAALLQLTTGALAAPTPAAPPSPLTAAQLGLVVNDDDPNSVAVAEAYRLAHKVPEKNIAHVSIPNSPRRLGAEQFAALKQRIDAQLGPQVEAVLMVWTAPYAVECNAITSAYTLGFDAAQCEKPCGPGTASPYFDRAAGLPRNQPGRRLSMLLPTQSVPLAKELIARGTARSFQLPQAGAYFLVTSDKARSSRAATFPPSGRVPQKNLAIHTLFADVLEDKTDIMVYQTGLAQVRKLDTLRFLPGALADHLTSTGGDLLGDAQMSSLRWLEAGATASYGSVSEPCNYWQKFPNGKVLLRHYLNGDTALEAYWKSVAWPSQGVFIGNPLAAPYSR